MIKDIGFLSEKGIRVTPQRIKVYQILKQIGHAYVEEIYEKVKKDFPAISLATVYTILEVFKKKGLIQELQIDPSRSVFDITPQIHHHFRCRICGKIYDVDIPFCKVLKDKKVKGHIIEAFQGYFYGVCKDCKKKGEGYA